MDLQWHPMMVHFPLALTFVGFICLLCSRLVSNASLRDSLAHTGTWTLILGGATILLTLATGLAAVWHLRLVGGAQYSVSRHVIWAVCTSQLIAILALWRALGTHAAAPAGWPFLMLLLIACAGLIMTGYYGGENVYHYALGVHKS
jgi:uncharacterized membrane protein